MLLKKVFYLIPIVGLTTALLTSCGQITTATKSFAEIVVSDNSSILKDKSFSESTYKGWQKFMVNEEICNRNGVEEKYQKEVFDMPSIDKKSSDFLQSKGFWRRPGINTEATFKWIFGGGASLIIAPGFSLQKSIESSAPKFENKGFLLLDATVDTTGGNVFSNVSTFLFRAEQSGFLAGIAASEFLNANNHIFGSDGFLKIGAYVGLAIPTTLNFMLGFQAGILAYNMKVIEEKSNKKLVEWISLGNDSGNYATGSFNVGGATLKSKELIKKGADIIMGISGPQVSDTVDAIITSGKPVAIVGVDSEQEFSSIQKPMPFLGDKKIKNLDGKTNSNNQNIIQFSAIKDLEIATYSVLASMFNKSDVNNLKKIENTKKGETFPVGGFGFQNVGVFENKTVGISSNGLSYLKGFDSKWVNEIKSKNEIQYEFDPSKGIYSDKSFINMNKNKTIYDEKLNDKNLLEALINNFEVNIKKLKAVRHGKIIDDLNEETIKPKKIYGDSSKEPLSAKEWNFNLKKNENNKTKYFKKDE